MANVAYFLKMVSRFGSNTTLSCDDIRDIFVRRVLGFVVVRLLAVPTRFQEKKNTFNV